MNETQGQELLFVINAKSGNNSMNWREAIDTFFRDKSARIHILELDESCSPDLIRSTIQQKKPAKVFAVGGDGTVKLVASCLLHQNIPLGIIPAG